MRICTSLKGLAFLLLFFCPDAFAQSDAELFWTSNRGIFSTSVENIQPEVILGIEDSRPDKVEVDGDAGKMYWIDGGIGRIFRANLDGSGKESLAEGQFIAPVSLTLDLSNDNMYLIDRSDGVIYRLGLDGSNIEALIKPLIPSRGGAGPVSLAIDSARGKIYWSDSFSNRINRANFDGTEKEILLSENIRPGRIALDLIADKIYFTNSAFLSRANLDGSEVEMIPPQDPAWPGSIALDTINSKVYWTNFREGIIQRANLDGSEPEDVFVDSLFFPSTITVAPDGSALYWVNSGTDKILKLDLSNNDVAPIISSDQGIPWDIQIDRPNGKMYWSDLILDTIQRANLDGSEIEEVVTGFTSRGFVIHPDNNNLYYTADSTIFRFDLNQGIAEPAITGLTFARYLALDHIAAKLYWINLANRSIQRANLDGTAIEDLIAINLQGPIELNLDLDAGKMYWLDTGKINRADLDGANIEVVYEEDNAFFRDLVVDPNGAKMYWISSSTNEIMQANKDGTDVESLGVFFAPTTLALNASAMSTGLSDEIHSPSTSAPILHSNFPNPFGAETTITYSLPESGHVRLTIFDILGREVDVLVDGAQAHGIHEVSWDGRGEAGPLPAGTYFLQIETADGYRATQPLTKAQ